MHNVSLQSLSTDKKAHFGKKKNQQFTHLFGLSATVSNHFLSSFGSGTVSLLKKKVVGQIKRFLSVT